MKAAHVFLLLAALTGATTCLLLRKHIFVKQEMTWTEAQTYCRNNYVDLSTIDTQDELTRFNTDVAADLSVQSWIGLNKSKSNNSFGQWSDGSAFGFTAWKIGKPDNLSTLHCVNIKDSLFSNSNCGNRFKVICYIWTPTLIIVPQMKTWHDALVHCRTQYTDLISLSTETDFLQVNKKFVNFQNASLWTGLRFVDGTWFWVNKEPLNNTSSLPSCPSPHLHCGARVGVNILQNRDCMEKMSFICYKI